nr:uncharacterized protein LOC122271582 [Parasteatoda tepidariorum]
MDLCVQSSVSTVKSSDTEGILFIWRIKNITAIKSPWWKSGFSFKWPLTHSKWIMNITVSDITKKTFYIAIRKRDNNYPTELGGLVSILTLKNPPYSVSSFDNFDFKAKDLKAIEIKSLQYVPYSGDILLPDDTLTLRIQLFSCSPLNSISAQFLVSSKYTEQECSFEWIVHSHTTSDGYEYFSSYVTEPPRYFTNFPCMESLDLNITLYFENALSPDRNSAVLIKYTSWYKYPFHAKFKLAIQDSKGNFETFANSNFLYFSDKTLSHCVPVLINIDELQNKKMLFYPKGALVLYCYVSVVTYSPAMIEDAFESSNNKNLSKFIESNK